MEFEGFAKIPRLNRNCTITEKIDGTNACVVVETVNLTNPATVDTVISVSDIPETPAVASGNGPWVVALSCCGRDQGTQRCPTWQAADEFRESYVDAGDHDRSAIIIAGPEDRLVVYAQSRTRIITPKEDNYGFAAWVESNKYALAVLLGPGRHFGEWWGQGIQRNYGLCEKRFSLFNTARWSKLDYDQWKALTDIGVYCVPILYEGPFSTGVTTDLLLELARYGSSAVPGFMKPEGIVIWHQAARCYFKATIENDAEWKGKQNG